MKTQSVCEIESLRAQVRELQQVVAELEERLAEVESEFAEDENEPVWGVWPYNWAVSGWEMAKNSAHALQIAAKRQSLNRHNTKSKNAAREQMRGEYETLHLVR